MSFGVPPNPEIPALGLGFPPLMLMPTELLFPPPAPFGSPDPEPAPEPPPVPLPFPSGEMATVAAKLPLGTSTIGAGGAGDTESAMTVVDEAPFAATAAWAGSGAAADSPACLCAATRGAEPALISKCGRAGPSAAVAMLKSEM